MGSIIFYVGILLVCIRVIYFTIRGKRVDVEEKQIFFTTCGVLFWFISLFLLANQLRGYYPTHEVLCSFLALLSIPTTLYISYLLFFKKGLKND